MICHLRQDLNLWFSIKMLPLNFRLNLGACSGVFLFRPPNLIGVNPFSCFQMRQGFTRKNPCRMNTRAKL